MTKYIAHSKNGQGNRHDLIEHLRTVATLAAEYAQALGVEAPELGRYLGLWHDVGKFNPKFQDYLLASEANPSLRGTGPDHKAAGSEIASNFLPILMLLVRGHHGGIYPPTETQQWLEQKKTEDTQRTIQAAIGAALQALPDLEPDGKLPFPAHVAADRAGTTAELFLRLLFSVLVDADCLDTEAHFYPEKAKLRGSQVGMEELWRRFEASQAQVQGKGSPVVSQVRSEIYQSCLRAAEEPPGLFRLTVPTGGGKTRSGMAFALRHAMRYEHKRVIVAVPFISITEQTAQTYRQIFELGEVYEERPVVLEHHSSIQDSSQEDDFLSSTVWRRLASENWDAPIVVTTTVQLFESLFANGTSRCRKLHRLAGSIIILDEAQALPAHLLRPILDALNQLCKHYGTTVVLSTATQPAFGAIPDFREMASEAREMVPDPARCFSMMKRVDYEWRTESTVSWDEVGSMMREEGQALAITNTKKDAIALLDALDDERALHLSTLLCGAHRRSVIKKVKARLQAKKPCLLVSTQVIEAGVDLDFPVVLRALGPLDSIIQAAGRCNREGLLPRLGRVVIFKPEEGGTPPGAYKIATNITAALLGEGERDPDDPGYAHRYFERLFNTLNIDREGIQSLRSRLNYPKVAEAFRMIDDDTVSLVVRYSPKEDEWEQEAEMRKVDKLLDSLHYDKANSRLIMRRLQPYVVSLRRKEAERVRDLIEAVMPTNPDDPAGVPFLGRWLGGYDRVRGLVGKLDPDKLVV